MIQDEFIDVVGAAASSVKEFEDGGIFYFEDRNPDCLGQMRTGRQKLDVISGTVEFCFRDNGNAYTAVLVDNRVYGMDGRLLMGDGKTEVMGLPYDIYLKNSSEDDEPVIPAGEEFIVTAGGKVKKNGNVTVDGTKYVVKNYVVVSVEE